MTSTRRTTLAIIGTFAAALIVGTIIGVAVFALWCRSDPDATISSPPTTVAVQEYGATTDVAPSPASSNETPPSVEAPPTTVFVIGGPDDPWGPVLCAEEQHPRHHWPCGQYPTTTTIPPNSYAATPVVGTATGACGGDLPPCWVMMRESGGDPNAVNPPPYGCSGNGCYGKWQFDLTTSQALGYPLPMNQYPESVQDEAARRLWNGGAGCAAWDACG